MRGVRGGVCTGAHRTTKNKHVGKHFASMQPLLQHDFATHVWARQVLGPWTFSVPHRGLALDRSSFVASLAARPSCHAIANSPSRTLVTADRILAFKVVKPSVSLRCSILVSLSQTLLNQQKAWSGFVEAATTAYLTLNLQFLSFSGCGNFGKVIFSASLDFSFLSSSSLSLSSLSPVLTGLRVIAGLLG